MLGDFTKTVFNETTEWLNIIIISSALLVLTGGWILYCYLLVVRRLQNNINAVTLRKLEKLFRENGDTDRLLEILSASGNDIVMVFYVCCRANIDFDEITSHLTYKSFKYINRKCKPFAFSLFLVLSYIAFVLVTFSYIMSRDSIDWHNPLFPILGFSVWALQLIITSIFFTVTQRKVNACWQEFKNLFISLQNHAKGFWHTNEESYTEFCERLIDKVQAFKRINPRVEHLVGRFISTGSYMRKPVTQSTQSQNSSGAQNGNQNNSYQNGADQNQYGQREIIREVRVENGQPPANSQEMELMTRMMGMMQQSMQHSQMMSQSMQQAQMMQYNQILQPSLQQHMIQNNIMMQNAHMQNMINQRNLMMATTRPLPPNPNPPERPALTPIFPPKKLETLTVVSSAPAPVISDTPKVTAEIKETPLPKITGKEITDRPFEELAREFRRKNAKLYADKRFQAPVVFLEPKREPTKIEKRLEEIFHAKVIHYQDDEWENLRYSESV